MLMSVQEFLCAKYRISVSRRWKLAELYVGPFTKTLVLRWRKKGFLIRTGRCAICSEAACADLSGGRREHEEDKNIILLSEGGQ